MSEQSAVIVRNLSKTFRLPHEQHSGIKQAIVSLSKGDRQKGYEVQSVLSDISFDIQKGEFFGIVGKNGSGKSTLLKLLAGIYTPDSGSVQVNGTLTPFIELGVGFNPELTGRENVYLNGALLGFSRNDMNGMYDGIVSFAELERFMDQKLKNYSSGMQVRLAFSIAIRANSDILLIDEVLAVGDAAFQTKCFDYFMELKKAKKTVILVSHDRSALERFCTNGVLVDNGRIIPTDSMEDLLDKYATIVMGQMHEKVTVKQDEQPADRMSVETIRLSVDGKTATRKVKFGQQATLAVGVKALQTLTNPIVGVTLWEKNTGQPVYAANNLTESCGELGVVAKGEKVTFEITLPDVLNDGEYMVEIGVANDAATVFFLRKREALTFRIFGSKNPHSIIATKGGMRIKG